MTRRRRALLLLGLALVMGGLAASDVAGREGRLRRQLEPVVGIVTARHPLAPGRRLAAGDVAMRRVPARFAPAGTAEDPAEVIGGRVAMPIPAGADLPLAATRSSNDTSANGPSVRTGERVAQVTAVAPRELVAPGERVDVLVTTQPHAGAPARTFVALEAVEVLATTPAPANASADDAGPRLAVSLRVTVRQAVFLAAAQSFARELRLLPRAPGDARRGAQGLSVGANLR
jgi:pilus assembly protein CpaB